MTNTFSNGSHLERVKRPDQKADYYILDTADLVDTFVRRWEEIVDRERGLGKAFGWAPDVSLIVSQVIDAMKNDQDVDMELQMASVDVACMSNHVLTYREEQHKSISDAQRDLANEAYWFGKALYKRLKELKVYHNGHFPFHYAGWNGQSILVELDKDFR